MQLYPLAGVNKKSCWVLGSGFWVLGSLIVIVIEL